MPLFKKKKTGHPASYYNDMFKGTPADVRAVLDKYSIHPPDDAGGADATGKTIRDIDTGGAEPVRVAKMAGNRVAYLDFTKGKKGQRVVSGNEGAKVLYATASYASNPAHVEAYWLPWKFGSIISLAIPAGGTGTGPDPDLFFTAAINGCSVFVRGPATAPTVYHCGGDTGQSTASAGAKFWRDLVTALSGTGGGGEVNKTHYIKTDGVTTTSKGLTVGTTQAAKEYQEWLEANSSKSIEIEETRPWGCVMGVRDAGGAWTFYLQENATVTYTVLKKKFGLFGPRVAAREKELLRDNDTGELKKKKNANTDKTVVIDQKRSVSRPVRVREIFPTASTGAPQFLPMPKTRHG